MRILICDDDALVVTQIREFIGEWFEKRGVKCPELVCFSDGASLLTDQGDKDLVFLDVEMPGMDGIYVGNELKKENDKIIIIIITSYSEYLDEAMRFQVFRYLFKPLDRQRFWRNLEDAMDLYHTVMVKIPVETKESVHTIPASSIIMVEAQGRKVTVHTTSRDFASIHNMQYWLGHIRRS